jgi:iron complex outermembrane recepter protein
MSKSKLLVGAALLVVFSAQAPRAFAEGEVIATASGGADELVVFGTGQTRQQSSITAAVIESAAPGTSPLKAIERIPGVSFQSADPFGNYEWSARISIRGFNQNQLGFTLDDVPLGDMSYGAFNGLHISRASISENIGRVEVSQGAGSLSAASSSNLGGTVQFVSKAPAEKLGLDAAATYGSEDTKRFYVRGDSGEIGPFGTKLSLSYVYQDTDKWKGVGEQKQQQINSSLVQPIGKGEITGFLNWSHRRENDYQDMSLGMLSRLGYKWDNISGNWPLAVQIADIANNRGDTGSGVITNAGAGTVYPGPFQTADDAYFNASGLRNDTIGSLKIAYPILDNLHVSLRGYGHQNEGQGLWYSPYVPTPLGAPGPGGAAITDPGPISVRTTEYDIKRYGAIGSVDYEIGGHTIEAGFWYENNKFHQARRFYGTSRTDPLRDSLEFQKNPFFTQWEYQFDTDTVQLHIQDTWKVTDALTLQAGMKSLRVTSDARTLVGANVDGSIEAKDDFLPQAGATFDLTRDHQLFIGYTENMRAYQIAATVGPFSTTPAGLAAIKSTLKPEESRTIEGGWRFRFGALQGSIAGYHVDFDNRLLTVALGPGIVGAPTALQNVGSVVSQGVEAAALWRFFDDWSLFGSYTFDDSKYQNNVLDATGALVAATKDKRVVDTPENLFRVELGYDNGALFGKIAAAYTGERYFTYLNDQKVDGYTLVELSAGYRVNEGPVWLRGTEVQFNVTNLTDEQYISTTGSNGFGNSGDSQTLLPGAPREFFVTVRKSF